MAGYSATGAFFRQAQAGAEQQKQARENLKNPGGPLGGVAAAGTSMVKSATQAEQNVAGNVAKTTESATKDLTAKDVGTTLQGSSSSMVVPTATTGTTPTPAPSTTPTAAPSTTPTAPTVIQTATGDVFKTSSNQTAIETNITNIQKTIDDLDEKLKTAGAQDIAAINAEKTRLTEELNKYNKMLTEGNLGEVAGPSTYETEMMQRMNLLAGDEIGNVGKLAALGGRNVSKFGGLSSQMYGKDIENLSEEAKQALRERGMATEERQRRTREFSEQLDLSKKGFEDKLDTATQRVELLKKSPDELKTTTKTEVEKLFGKDLADKLFDFDDKGYVSNTNTNAVRQVYVTAKSDQEKILEDQKLESTRALENETKDLGSTKNLANKIIKEAGEFGSWLGERAPTAIAPIIGRLDKLVADFNEQQKYFKTPEERQTALNALNQNISNEKTNLANELGAFLADINTNRNVALKAYDMLKNNNLFDSLSPSMKAAVQVRFGNLTNMTSGTPATNKSHIREQERLAAKLS